MSDHAKTTWERYVSLAQDYLSVPGWLPVKQVASILGICEERVCQHVRARRLEAVVVEHRYLIAEHSVQTFRSRPHGRVRQVPVKWNRYRAGAVVRMLTIEVPVIAGQQGALCERLTDLYLDQHHLFPGTMQRFIALDPAGVVTIVLIWKNIEMQDDMLLQQDLTAFKNAFADVLDWSTAHEVQSQALAYT